MLTEEVEVTIADNFKFTEHKATIKRPPVTVGEPVTWYREASRLHAVPAMVYKVGDRNISVMLLAPGLLGQVVDSVLHIDDPKLAENQALRLHNGGWDWTVQYKQFNQRIKMLEERVAALVTRFSELEDVVSKPEAKGHKK